MTITVPEFVSEVLSRFDTSLLPLGEPEIVDALRSAMKNLPAGDESLRDGWFAETAAFGFAGSRHATDLQDIDADIIAQRQVMGDRPDPDFARRAASAYIETGQAPAVQQPDQRDPVCGTCPRAIRLAERLCRRRERT